MKHPKQRLFALVSRQRAASRQLLSAAFRGNGFGLAEADKLLYRCLESDAFNRGTERNLCQLRQTPGF